MHKWWLTTERILSSVKLMFITSGFIPLGVFLRPPGVEKMPRSFLRAVSCSTRLGEPVGRTPSIQNLKKSNQITSMLSNHIHPSWKSIWHLMIFRHFEKGAGIIKLLRFWHSKHLLHDKFNLSLAETSGKALSFSREVDPYEVVSVALAWWFHTMNRTCTGTMAPLVVAFEASNNFGSILIVDTPTSKLQIAAMLQRL